MIGRRAVLASLGAALATPALAQFTTPQTLTDVTGARVTLPRPPRHILLGDGMLFTALSLVDPDVAERIVLMDVFMKRYDPGFYAELVRLYPGFGAIPILNDFGSAGLEQALEAAPDLVILSLWQTSSTAAAVAQFRAMGVPVAFVDFFIDPLSHTNHSMQLLGGVLGQQDAADAYAGYYAAALDRVAKAGLSAHPESVLLHVYPGLMSCCWAAGSAGFGRFAPLAGGRAIGADTLPGAFGGALSLEYILAADPRFYIAAGLSSHSKKGLVIGFGIDQETAQRSFGQVLVAPDLSEIPAVVAGRAYGLWNFFNGSPLSILAIEVMAEWFHPTLARAAGIDPDASFDRIRRDFLKRDLTGTLWVAAEGAG
jgi:iron complex transport system substrate-binding protein